MPIWRGISCPDQAVATCRSASRTYQCNEYGHWEGVVTRGNVMKRRRRKKNWAFPRNEGGEEVGVEEKRKQQKR